MNQTQNILINIKNKRSPNYPFDDPNYVPRTRVEQREVIRDNEKITRTVTRFNIPLSGLDRKTLEDMQRLPHQQGGIMTFRIPNPNSMSSRKHPRITNNKSRYASRYRKTHTGVRLERVRVRPLVIKRLSKEAVAILASGDKSTIRLPNGQISKKYIVRRLKGVKQAEHKTYGFNKAKIKKQKS